MAVKKEGPSQRIARRIANAKSMKQFFCDNKEVVEKIEQQAKDKAVQEKTESYNRARTSVKEGLGRLKWDDPNWKPNH